ncbi:MAG: hypothetical protein AB7R89_16310 [Dehalococcoidia bacterium]
MPTHLLGMDPRHISGYRRGGVLQISAEQRERLAAAVAARDQPAYVWHETDGDGNLVQRTVDPLGEIYSGVIARRHKPDETAQIAEPGSLAEQWGGTIEAAAAFGRSLRADYSEIDTQLALLAVAEDFGYAIRWGTPTAEDTHNGTRAECYRDEKKILLNRELVRDDMDFVIAHELAHAAGYGWGSSLGETLCDAFGEGFTGASRPAWRGTPVLSNGGRCPEDEEILRVHREQEARARREGWL